MTCSTGMKSRGRLGARLRKTLVALTLAVSVVVVTAAPAQAAPFTHLFQAPVSGGYYYITNWDNNRCMDVAEESRNNGGRMQTWNCEVRWNQQFQFVSIGEVNGVRAWRIKPRHTIGSGSGTGDAADKCLDVEGGVSGNNIQVQIWQCHNGWQQMFEMQDYYNRNGEHRYHIKPVYTHDCLDNPWDVLGSSVLMRSCVATETRQAWTLGY